MGERLFASLTALPPFVNRCNPQRSTQCAGWRHDPRDEDGVSSDKI
jgi:hypothetical protein